LAKGEASKIFRISRNTLDLWFKRKAEKHVTSLFRKTDTNNRAELMGYAIENQLR